MRTAAAALWASIVRTIVPLVVGAVLGWVTARGIPVDAEFEDLFTAFLTAGFSAAYYVAVRLLETYVAPKLGWLIGLAKSPDHYTADSPAKHRADTPPHLL